MDRSRTIERFRETTSRTTMAAPARRSVETQIQVVIRISFFLIDQALGFMVQFASFSSSELTSRARLRVPGNCSSRSPPASGIARAVPEGTPRHLLEATLPVSECDARSEKGV